MSDDLDYGPLRVLIGKWEGGSGMDVAPETDGIEENPYFETILYEEIGDVENAKEQTLLVLRYHQIVSRKSNNQVFHNETGYWSWDAATGVVMQSLTIPRGLALLAGGTVTQTEKGTVFNVKASLGSSEWQIVQSPFMKEKATTTAFSHEIIVKGDEMQYSETTSLKIYGKSFKHTDGNKLKRIS
jgi:hypothetical protein